MTQVTYVVTLECEHGHEHTFAYEAEWVPADQEQRWPTARFCPTCTAAYPTDLGEAWVEDAIVERVENPEVPPEER